MPKNTIAALNDPVKSFKNPTKYGPKNPPKLPILLIMAIAPPAAAPVKNEGGIDQNGENAPNAPHKAIVNSPNDEPFSESV